MVAPSGPEHFGQGNVYARAVGKSQAFLHWACYWYDKLDQFVKSNPAKEVGKIKRSMSVGFRLARAVGVLTPLSFPKTFVQILL